jgi:ABC-type multidrug transport system permease subunit
MFNRIMNLATKELIQLTRNWLLLIFIILGPTMELALLARATRQGTTHLPMAIVDQGHSQVSRQIVSALDNTEELDLVAYLDSPDQVDAWFKRTQGQLAVILPAGLEADLDAGTAQVQLIADGTNSTTSSVALSAAVGVINDFSARRMSAYLRDWPAIDLHTQIRYNPTLDADRFTITAQLGFVIYQVALVVAVAGLTRERELGTLEQLMITPIRRLELTIGKAIPALIVASVDFILMWAIAVWGFHVPMRGSFLLLMGLSLLFIIAEIGWGLTFSAISRTQQQAALMIFVLALVDVSFSGYVMPVERMPFALRMVAQIFPLQHYLVVIRSIMLKGATLPAVWNQAWALGALSVGSIGVAVVSLRNHLE